MFTQRCRSRLDSLFVYFSPTQAVYQADDQGSQVTHNHVKSDSKGFNSLAQAPLPFRPLLVTGAGNEEVGTLVLQHRG